MSSSHPLVSPLIKVSQVSKSYLNKQHNASIVLNDISFSVEQGECIALLGASGSGKSTLIKLMCGLVPTNSNPSSISINSKLVQSNGRLSSELLQARESIGVIFQQFNLVGQLDVMTNVLIGSLPKKTAWDIVMRRFTEEEKVRALMCIDNVGLSPQAYQRASTLSGGQQQRAAVARALLKNAKVLFADEPVASLDPESAKKVMDVLLSLTRQFGLTLIISLHQIAIARTYCQRALGLHQGKLVYDGPISDLNELRLRSLYGNGAIELLETNDCP